MRRTTHMRAGGEGNTQAQCRKVMGKGARQARCRRLRRAEECGLRKSFLTPSRKNPKTPSHCRMHPSGSEAKAEGIGNSLELQPPLQGRAALVGLADSS